MIWKILFVIYVLAVALLHIMGLYDTTNLVKTPFLDAIGNYSVEFLIVLTLVYTFSLGWKKRLINSRFHKIFWIFSIVAFILSAFVLYKNTYAPMYSDMLLQAMERGMVPRHWDFQLLLGITRIEVLVFVTLMLFLIFAPFYLGYYHYSKQMENLNIAEHTGRKCFAIYTAFSMFLVFLSVALGISGNFINFNIFDCFSLLSGVYLLAGVIGYAFKLEILNQTFWRIGLPICVVIELMPSSFYTKDFLACLGYSHLETSPVYMIASYLFTAVAIFMIYRYASTDVVFKNVENNAEEE